MEPISLLHDRRILLGVTGGIAAYKICTLASRLTQAGAQVDMVMTEPAIAPSVLLLVGQTTIPSVWNDPLASLLPTSS